VVYIPVNATLICLFKAPLLTSGTHHATLGLQILISILIGALLLLAAPRMKFDLAVVASPALTTIVDITGLLIYFKTAKLLVEI
jgi:Mg/Co/Ni transporter MgtE